MPRSAIKFGGEKLSPNGLVCENTEESKVKSGKLAGAVTRFFRVGAMAMLLKGQSKYRVGTKPEKTGRHQR